MVDQAINAEWAEYELHQVVLPSSLLEKNSYNAHIFEIDPFAVNLYLPVRWTVQEADGLLAATADVVQEYSASEGREETRNRGILL